MQLALLLTSPGRPTVRIGPFDNKVAADQFRCGLGGQLHATPHPEGLTVALAPFDPLEPHLAASLPQEARELVMLLLDHPVETFPELYTRLRAEHGPDDAEDIWEEVQAMAADFCKARPDGAPGLWCALPVGHPSVVHVDRHGYGWGNGSEHPRTPVVLLADRLT
ncbi:hypothetical protein [Streptomyces sp. NRRL S-350]|uniref:hypothetical protein n=1 Tax=Streptomyces sp. NRRL S-350 TaxID=1463902 RepID=UPI0004C12453|nr:hypothetical protein [Streptomyces sp. NRRL S-350]